MLSPPTRGQTVTVTVRMVNMVRASKLSVKQRNFVPCHRKLFGASLRLSLAAPPAGRSRRRYFRPEFLMAEHVPFPNLPARGCDNFLQAERVSHEQPLDLGFILNA